MLYLPLSLGLLYVGKEIGFGGRETNAGLDGIRYMDFATVAVSISAGAIRSVRMCSLSGILDKRLGNPPNIAHLLRSFSKDNWKPL
jgi:hypothetical protein